ncbi:MAG: hypothetical protein R3E89_11875 [Thiolinea sp.]
MTWKVIEPAAGVNLYDFDMVAFQKSAEQNYYEILDKLGQQEANYWLKTEVLKYGKTHQ